MQTGLKWEESLGLVMVKVKKCWCSLSPVKLHYLWNTDRITLVLWCRLFVSHVQCSKYHYISVELPLTCTVHLPPQYCCFLIWKIIQWKTSVSFLCLIFVLWPAHLRNISLPCGWKKGWRSNIILTKAVSVHWVLCKNLKATTPNLFQQNELRNR